MGRKRTKDKDLPSRVYLRHGAYYFAAPDGKWTRLGATKPEMLRAYADLIQGGLLTFAALADRYRTAIMPRKAAKTQAEQSRQLDRLVAVFGKMPAAAIRRGMVAQYRDMRPPVAANRELALLSHIFARAMEWEIVTENPCTSVERNTEKPRERYVAEDEYAAVLASAPAPARSYQPGLGSVLKS